MTLPVFNAMSAETALARLLECCHSRAWATRLLAERPFKSVQALTELASEIWFSVNETAWLEAFAAHPKIGDLDVLRDKYAVMASLEQGQVQQASDATLHGLADLNQLYERRFGFIFIVFATGKSAEAMLALLRKRLNNNRNLELETNALEQNKITLLRLRRLFQVDKIGS
ncbi:MAG TPA: 2-oxo-4-hydroxy-4-carboxy-5-ureidoimidazoline decarboxylase [Gammaproteobacteria bacterium]|nr:2-oxo-4-hydroxy-4-carboxy-5-ureidoimidazoline decarboxylase [Gammaproteobacteria bacterium]HIK70289.1 2-oxo-4-hydroxy-4-carboxy-5-ureidoimidazoline decarboxylase [Pseudomonadales bacterium]